MSLLLPSYISLSAPIIFGSASGSRTKLGRASHEKMAFKILDSRCQDPEYVFGSMNILYTCAEAGELLTGNLTDTVYQCLCDYCEKSDPDLLGCPYQAIITLFGFDVDLDPYPYFSDNSRYSDSINKQENTDIGSPGVSGGSVLSSKRAR